MLRELASSIMNVTAGGTRVAATLAVSLGEGAYPALGATRRMVQTGEPAFQAVLGAVWEEQLARDPVASKRFNRLAAARTRRRPRSLAKGLGPALSVW